MGVDKVVLKAFLNSLAAVALLLVFMLTVLIGVYPSTMMEITYDLGLDSSSIRCAERAYKWSDDEYYIAYAMEVAIGMGDNEKIAACGEKLIEDEQFFDFCAAKNEKLSATLADESFLADIQTKGLQIENVSYMTYAEYVYGQVCVAEYEENGASAAIERAFALTFNGESEKTAFPQNNAVTAVLYTALGDRNAEAVNMIKGKMAEQKNEGLSQGDKAYFDWIFALTNG